MTIKDIFYKYRGHINNVTITRIGDISESIYSFNHIILEDIPPLDAESQYTLIWNILSNCHPGTSIYIDESPTDFIDVFQKNFVVDDGEHNNGIKGIAIQHIIGVGYIISSVNEGKLFIFKEFTLEEYEKLSNEYIVLGIAKCEEHYIRDWVSYHLRIGFDRIYLMDNNDKEAESYKDILSDFVESGRVNIIDIRGLRGMQNNMYNMLYYSIPYKWMAIIDIDEYIWFNEVGKYSNIKQFIDNVTDYNSSRFGIMLQWHCYASSGEDKPSDKPIWEVNTKLLPFNSRKDCRCEFIHNWCKSIYKPGYRLTLNEHFAWETIYNEYGVISNCISEVDCNGDPITKDDLINIPYDKFINQDVFVKHFMLRNIDDFFKRKYLRGHAGGDFGVGEDGWRFYQWSQNMNYYTDLTDTISPADQIYLAKHGMKANYTFHPDVIINWYRLPNTPYINTAISDNILTWALLGMANCFLNVIDIDAPNAVKQPIGPGMPTQAQNSLDFLTRWSTNYNYFDINMGDESNIIRKHIQDPIVINIGIPIKYAVDEISIEEQKNYVDFLIRVLNTNSIKNYLRGALEEGITTIPTIGIEDINNCYGFKQDVDEILGNMGLSDPHKALINNTMIMPYKQYMEIKKLQQKFLEKYGLFNNSLILSYLSQNITTPYHAYISSVMAVIKNPYFVWPN